MMMRGHVMPHDYMPPEIAAPVAVLLLGAALFQRRQQIAEWLGWKDKK